MPDALLFHFERMPFMTSHDVNLVRFDLTFERWFWGASHDTVTEGAAHGLHVIIVESKFLCDLRIR